MLGGRAAVGFDLHKISQYGIQKNISIHSWL